MIIDNHFSLIRRSVWINIPLHQRRSCITLLTCNKAELFINFALIFVIKNNVLIACFSNAKL